MVALRAFMSLADYLKHPKDTAFVLKFMHKSKSNLRYNSLDWMIENVTDKKELLALFEDKEIPEDVKQEAIDRVKIHPMVKPKIGQTKTYTSLRSFQIWQNSKP
ncbi:hypothetical protein OS493_008816 [Desmophyllum pertusum]|uniref:Uncharacterized protein n=1 Tax=Desmophyllum pertusum TaxID=174260 RepID=A0A9W9ZI10_9CNID|nr:hypothetical protein OS493_008816 [Desmophyllum pertusum]